MNSRRLLPTLRADVRAKARWCYEDDRWLALIKTLTTDGTMAMIIYRLMQWSRRWKLFPLEMFFNKLNGVLCHCIIGRGAEFGPGFVLIHSTGVVINGRVRGGENVVLEHQVTIGAEQREVPFLAANVFIGAGAKVVGGIRIGEGARIGANAVVTRDVDDYCTVAGNPAILVARRTAPASLLDISAELSSV